MVSRERLLLAVAADRRELAAFAGARRLDMGPLWAVETELAGVRAWLIAGGVGEAAAVAAIQRAIDCAASRFQPAALVSTGYAGALSPELQVGNIVVVDRLRRAGAALEYPVYLPDSTAVPTVRRGSLLTVDRVIQTAAEKARLHELEFDAVDMEAAGVAEEAERLGLPFYAIRVISDEAAEDLELDFNRARRANGAISGWSILFQAGLKPSRWRKLLELKHNSERASAALGRVLPQCRFPSQILP